MLLIHFLLKILGIVYSKETKNIVAAEISGNITELFSTFPITKLLTKSTKTTILVLTAIDSCVNSLISFFTIE
ncbi:hypothetical protein D3C73_1420090 [compost metagenome]